MFIHHTGSQLFCQMFFSNRENYSSPKFWTSAIGITPKVYYAHRIPLIGVREKILVPIVQFLVNVYRLLQMCNW